MNPLFDAFRFWQQVWFEALRHLTIFEGSPRVKVTSDPVNAAHARFGVLRRHREFPSDYVAARNVDVWGRPRMRRRAAGGSQLFTCTTARICSIRNLRSSEWIGESTMPCAT
jgi:hypothetical protein